MSTLNSKTMQNLVVLMEPSEDPRIIDMRVGNMILNRFCIDEDAAFELSGVKYFKKSSWELRHGNFSSKWRRNLPGNKFKVNRKVKGRGNYPCDLTLF